MLEYPDIRPRFVALETQAFFDSPVEPKLIPIIEVAQNVCYPFKLIWITHGMNLMYYKLLDKYSVPMHAHFIMHDPAQEFFTKALKRFDLAFVPMLLQRNPQLQFRLRMEPTVERFVEKLVYFSNPVNYFDDDEWRKI